MRAAIAEKKWSILGTVVAVFVIGRSFLFARIGENAAERNDSYLFSFSSFRNPKSEIRNS
jgi:hypothetical protein